MNVLPASRVGETPEGFAQIFPGWNVWSVWGSDDPNQGLTGTLMNTGLSLERQLRIWVEDTIKDGAPGAAVADPMNPGALRGDQIQIIPSPGGLEVFANRESIPSLAGALQLGEEGSKALLYIVRFFNRGQEAVLPWPHDENYLLESIFRPSADNQITSGPAPSSLAGTATEAGKAVSGVVKTVAIVAGVAAGIGLIVLIANASRKAA